MNKLVTKCVSASIKIKFQGKLCCSPWNRYFSDAMRFERPLLQVLVLELPAVAFLLLTLFGLQFQCDFIDTLSNDRSCTFHIHEGCLDKAW